MRLNGRPFAVLNGRLTVTFASSPGLRSWSVRFTLRSRAAYETLYAALTKPEGSSGSPVSARAGEVVGDGGAPWRGRGVVRQVTETRYVYPMRTEYSAEIVGVGALTRRR